MHDKKIRAHRPKPVRPLKLCRGAELLRCSIYLNVHRPKPLARSFNHAAELSRLATQFYRNRFHSGFRVFLQLLRKIFDSALPSSETTSTEASCVFSRLNHEGFMLPGSIWREDKSPLTFRQQDSGISPVQICACLCKNPSAAPSPSPQEALSLSPGSQLQSAHAQSGPRRWHQLRRLHGPPGWLG
jgi:hypothetical protein